MLPPTGTVVGMNKPKPIFGPAVKVLSWLLDLAVQRAGYTVRGVRGWATAEQIETGVKSWGTAELMRAEAKRGRVLQHDARPPRDSRPSWLYRISQPGAGGVTEHQIAEQLSRMELFAN